MAYTIENNYTGNASTTLYSFTFPYLDTTDIKVSLDQVDQTLTTHYTLASPTQISFVSAPGSGVAIRIYRDTDISNLQSEFFSGSAIRAQDLNDDFNQTLYVSQETQGLVTSMWNDNAETITSSETWLDSDVHIATCAAIEDKINLITSGGVFTAADPTKMPLAGGTFTGDVIHNYNTAVQMPTGTTAQRPGSPTNGDFRYNSDDSSFEGYQGGSWGAVGGGATGPSGNAVFWENDQTVSDDYTITNNKNAGSFGPIAVATGKTVTVGAGEVWTVV